MNADKCTQMNVRQLPIGTLESTNKGLRSFAFHLRSSAFPKLLAGITLYACALNVSAGVTVSDAWVRGTVPAQKVTGAFMTLRSSEPAKVVGVSTPAAESAEIHASEHKAGVMHMHAIDSLELPAGKRVELKPGGHHMMLQGLAKPLAPGQKVPITLTLEDARGKRTQVEVQAEVRPLGQ